MRTARRDKARRCGDAGTVRFYVSTRAIALRTASEIAHTLRAGLDLVLPRVCPGCFAPEPWCERCAATLEGRPRAVAVPEAMLDDFAARDLAIPTVHALSRYSGPVRKAIVAGKERGRRDLPPLLGAALGRGLAALQDVGVLDCELWLVPAPTRASSARARGGDPVTVMARAAAGILAASGRATGVAPCLYLARGTRDSVGLDAAERSANLAHSVRFRRTAAPPRGASVVLLDDVLTSGATVARSSLTLAQWGLQPAGALVLAAVPQLRPLVVGRRDVGASDMAVNRSGGRRRFHGRFEGVPGPSD